GDEHCVSPHAGLGLDEIVVVLNRLRAEVEVRGDLLLGRTGRELSQDLDLAFSQLFKLVARRAEAVFRQSARDVVADRPLAAGDRTDRPDEHSRLAALSHIAARTGVERSLHLRRFAVHAEDEYARTAVAQSDVPDGF